MRAKFAISISIVLLGITIGCNSQKNQKGKESFNIPDSLLMESTNEIHKEAMFNVIENLGSPVEVSAMLHDLGIPYYSDILTPTEKAKNLNTSFDQSLMLGAMSADLGYLNIYMKNTPIIDYISSIKLLSDDLEVGQFFDFNTLKRLSENKHDLDSLMFISVHSFNEMNSYLERTHRSAISSLVITGLWLEGMYLATQVALNHSEEALYESIGEQKIIMEDLFSILKAHRNTPGFPELIAELELLKKEFADVEISYIEGEPEMMEDENGMLVIIQNETSLVTITENQIKSVSERTTKIRNHLLNL